MSRPLEKRLDEMGFQHEKVISSEFSTWNSLVKWFLFVFKHATMSKIH